MVSPNTYIVYNVYNTGAASNYYYLNLYICKYVYSRHPSVLRDVDLLPKKLYQLLIVVQHLLWLQGPTQE